MNFVVLGKLVYPESQHAVLRQVVVAAGITVAQCASSAICYALVAGLLQSICGYLVSGQNINHLYLVQTSSAACALFKCRWSGY